MRGRERRSGRGRNAFEGKEREGERKEDIGRERVSED